MEKMFNREFLREELGLPYEALEKNIVENTRWSIVFEIVFEYEGKFWKTWYSEGATEYQDERPWEFEKEVKCYEVYKAKTVKEDWVEVEKVDRSELEDESDFEFVELLEEFTVSDNEQLRKITVTGHNGDTTFTWLDPKDKVYLVRSR